MVMLILIWVSMLRDRDAAETVSIRKARQVIDEQRDVLLR